MRLKENQGGILRERVDYKSNSRFFFNYHKAVRDYFMLTVDILMKGQIKSARLNEVALFVATPS